MAYLDIDKLRTARVETEPYSYTIVSGFLSPQSIQRINATYPSIEKGGSFPVENLEPGMAIKDVIDELDGPEFEQVIADKFDVDLADRPKMYSLRAHTTNRDGHIHTDTRDKIITVLLYLNESWPRRDGRLRILRNGHDLDDFAAEVPPDQGTLLVFKRSDNSWHGHLPFEGPRRSLQMNWVTSERSRGWHKVRHTISAAVKTIGRT